MLSEDAILVACDLDLNLPADGICGCHSSSPILEVAVICGTPVPELPVVFTSGVTATSQHRVELVFLSERWVGSGISAVTYIS